ncbi:MAG: hypothetical protein DLM50_02935 [Candidatus Meridianibacter frigidus]|nr:MAG: hypothetical protein DLM50_02935 [Candidatus Eremiobacteraeota bacterium]
MFHASKTFALGLGLLVLGAAPSDQPPGPDADGLLHLSMLAPTRLSYVGRLESVQFGGSKSEATIYRIEHRAPNLTRRWYLAPQSLFGDWSLTRGSTAYNVDVKRKRIYVSTNKVLDDQVALDDNFGLLTSNYRVLPAPPQTVAGRVTIALLLINKYTGQIAMRLWIDKETKLVLQKESYSSNGAVTRQLRFDEIRYTADLPAPVFQPPNLPGFTMGKGATHHAPSNDLLSVVKAAGFSAGFPKYLPDGFLPVAGDVSDIKSIRNLHLLYSDGIRTLSLYENALGAAVDLSRFRTQQVHFQDYTGDFVQDGSTTLLAWHDEGLHFALVGELSRAELVKIASSVAK